MTTDSLPDVSDQEHLDDFECMLEHTKKPDTGSYRVMSYEHFFQLPSSEQQVLYDDLVILQHT